MPWGLARGGPAYEVGDLVGVLAGDGARRARVVERYGRPGDVMATMAAYAAEVGLARAFPAGALREARALPADPGPAEAHRRDLTATAPVTIDPVGARDHDDAVEVARTPEGFRALIHIADVAALVPAGSELDREARERLFSAYLPGRVDPMLPPELSSLAASLLPGRPRDAVTVESTFDAAGGVRGSSVYRSRIVVRRRLTYDEAESELQAGPGPLADAEALCDLLRTRRLARGALALQRPELVLVIDGERVASGRMDAEPRAHAVVEELMLHANVVVAERLAASGAIPLRVHEPPDPAAVERLYAQLADLRVPTAPLPEVLSSRQAMRAVAEAARSILVHTAHRGGREPFSMLVLRSLMQARYDVSPLGHAGLAAPLYTHFTSPIRRYPDLLVHRALADSLAGRDPRRDPELDAVCAEASDRERLIARFERQAQRISVAHLVHERLHAGELGAHHGEVTGVTAAGLFVRFEAAAEGYLPARRLPRDWYDPSPLQTALVGRSSGHRIALGDRLDVVVDLVEPPLGRITLDLA